MSRPFRRPCLTHLVVVAAALALAATRPAFAADAPAKDPEAARRAAVEKGLAHLSGRWGEIGDDASKASADRPAGVATAALSGLAFLQAGATPGRKGGPFDAPAAACVAFVLSRQTEAGAFAAAGENGPMYGHGLALLFLSEAAVRAADEPIKARLKQAVDRGAALTAKAQNAQGGWRYRPVPLDADVSVTAGQLAGLAAARRAGATVDQRVIDRGIAFVRTCQAADGGFVYMPQGQGTYPARSAGATAALFHAGAKADDPSVAPAVDYLIKAWAAEALDVRPMNHFAYGSYQAAQALYLAGGEARQTVLPALAGKIVVRQRADGAWDGDISTTFSTAIALVVLQMPDGKLSIVQPPPPGT